MKLLKRDWIWFEYMISFNFSPIFKFVGPNADSHQQQFNGATEYIVFESHGNSVWSHRLRGHQFNAQPDVHHLRSILLLLNDAAGENVQAVHRWSQLLSRSSEQTSTTLLRLGDGHVDNSWKCASPMGTLYLPRWECGCDNGDSESGSGWYADGLLFGYHWSAGLSLPQRVLQVSQIWLIGICYAPIF